MDKKNYTRSPEKAEKGICNNNINALAEYKKKKEKIRKEKGSINTMKEEIKTLKHRMSILEDKMFNQVKNSG